MKRALIFAHFDRMGIVDPHVLFSLQAYRAAFDHVIAVSTAELGEEEQAKVRRYADRLIVRENAGYDFMSWKEGFGALADPDAYDEIIFANDSVYGPLFPLEDMFAKASALDADMWGQTISQGISRHVQSYFLAFRKSLIASGALAKFWNGVERLDDKRQIIMRYEVGLSRWLLENGYKIGAVFEKPCLSLPRRIARTIALFSLKHPQESRQYFNSQILRFKANPNHFDWVDVIEAGAPYVKVELLRDNPTNRPLGDAFEILQRYTGYDVGLIERHLERMRAS